MADVKIRWLLQIVDQNGPAKLLAEDRKLRSSLKDTDTSYSQMSRTATSVAAKQAEAAKVAADAAGRQADVTGKLRDTTISYRDEQQKSASIGLKALDVNDRLTAALDRQAGAIRKLIAEESKLRDHRSRSSSAASGLGSSLSGLGGAALGVAKTGLLGVAGVAGVGGDLAVKGLERGARLRAGAAGLSGLTGLNPREAQALALIAESENVSARGLGTSFATLGAKLVAQQKHEREVASAVASGGKAPKANAAEEAFSQLHIAPSQINSLKGNLPAAFDLVFQRASKLPPAEQASVLKTFLGRGATIGGQIELGGPLTKQLHEVGGTLSGIDPKRLEELHATEIKLKQATAGLELQFASTFGPSLVKLFRLVIPAIKPLGAALHTSIAVPLGLAKQYLPGVLRGLKAGVTGLNVGVGQRNAVTSPGHKAVVAGAGERTPSKESELEQIGGKVGGVLRTVGTEAAKYGKQLLDAFKPAAPFFENVLVPVLEGFATGVVGAFKIAVPIIEVAAKALGVLGSALGPLAPALKIVGLGFGVLLAGPVLGMLTDIPKIGFVFSALGLPIKLAGGAVGGFGRILGGLGGVLTKSVGLFDKFPGRIGALGGSVAKAAGSLTSSVGRGLSGIGAVVSGKGTEAANDLGKSIRAGAGKALSAGKAIAEKAAEGVGVLAGKVTSVVSTATKPIWDSMFNVGWKMSAALEAGLVVGILGLGALMLKKIKEQIGSIKIGFHPGNVLHGKSPFTIETGSHETTSEQVTGQVKRRGGLVFGGGGFVPAMVSPGEQIIYGNQSLIVPGTPTAADTVGMSLPVGAAVLTWDGQAQMAAGASLGQAIATQRPHFATGGVVTGRVSTFGPPGDAAGTTASGVSSSQAGVAIRPGDTWQTGKPFLGKWWQIAIQGHSGRLRQIDLGPNQSTGRRIDVTGAGARALGIDPSRFPTDATGTATLLGGGAAVTASTSASSAALPALHREGLIRNALQQGIEGGSSLGAFLGELAGRIGGTSTSTTGVSGGKLPAGVTTPSATWNPSRKPIDRWIVPYLSYGASHGWGGTVTSGYRSKAEQERIYNSGVRPAARPGTSHHEGTAYPSGAVDVTSAASLSVALQKMKGPHLLQWAGSKDPVHFSHPYGGGYRRGGIAGYGTGGIVGRVSPAISQLQSSSPGAGRESALTAIAKTIEGLALTQIGALRSALVRSASKGGPSNVIRSFQAVISEIDFLLGRRIEGLYNANTLRTSALSRGAAASERFLRSSGIDPSSARGLTLATAGDAQAAQVLKGNVARAQAAVQVAKKGRDPKAIELTVEKLTEAQTELDEAITKGIEDRRNLLRQAAQESTEAAQFGVSSAQNALSGLDIAQRLNRSAETPGGEQEKAAAIQGSLLPALQGNLAAYNSQLGVLQQTGASAAETQSVLLNIQTAGNEIGSALAEVAELTRKAGEQAAEETVEHAQHAVSFAELGLQRVETEERINGSYEGSGSARADYIAATVIPALTAEVAALKEQAATAAAEGNPKLAEQIAIEIYERENGVKQAQLQELEDINGNTTRKPGGTLGFVNNGETLNDVIVGVGSGL